MSTEAIKPFIIEGDLSFATVSSYLDKSKEITLSKTERLAIDFSDASNVDSAGVAFCLRCARQFGADNYPVILRSRSSRLMALLEEYKLAELFEIA